MTLAARRPIENYYRKRGVNDFELIELVERTMHMEHNHAGPMFMCGDDYCRDWVGALKDWGVIR